MVDFTQQQNLEHDLASRATRASSRDPLCPACKSEDTRNQGRLPRFPGNAFGGVQVEAALDSGSLFHCSNCDLFFRHPYLSQAACLKLYESLPASVWKASEPRSYWDLARRMIESPRANSIILDCGCFTGDFLAWLPGKWRKLGIEPNRRAVAEAAAKGVQILGPTIGAVADLEERAGTITLFDVLEHVAEPVSFLDQLRRLLAPGGAILVMTGGTDTLPWRLFGRHYWYCSLPEHVSFFSVKWFAWAAAELGFKVERYRYLSSESRILRLWAKQSLQISAFTLVQRLRDLGWSERVVSSVPGFRRVAHWQCVPWWKQATDHIMILLRA